MSVQYNVTAKYFCKCVKKNTVLKEKNTNDFSPSKRIVLHQQQINSAKEGYSKTWMFDLVVLLHIKD